MTEMERWARRHDRTAAAYEDVAWQLRNLYDMRHWRPYVVAALALRRLARDERRTARYWRRPRGW